MAIAGRGLTSRQVKAVGAVEIAVHGWDIAEACRCPRPIPPALATSILANEQWAWLAIVIVTVWQAAPGTIIIYLAGLQAIPTDIYEAGSLDGAGAWRQFRSLTLPLMVEPKVALVFALGAILALFATSGIGVFHAGVEQHWWQGPQACSGRVPAGLSAEELKKFLMGARMVRCDEIPWQMWNISMAGWNAILSGTLAIVLSLSVLNHIRAKSS